MTKVLTVCRSPRSRYAKTKLILLPLLLVFSTNCQKRLKPEELNRSQVAIVRIDDFVPPADREIWETVEIRISKLPEDRLQVEKKWDRSAFSSGTLEDSKIAVNYGDYKISLVYKKNGQNVYQSCPEELTKTHVINQPEYPAVINICPVKTNDKNIDKNNDGGANPTTPVGTAGKPLRIANPFEGRSLFVNPGYRDAVVKAADQTKKKYGVQNPILSQKMLKIKETPTAIWLDRIDAISLMEPALKAARLQQKDSEKPVVVTFIVYNLPERDCAAYASAGELLAAENGMNRYKNDYINPIKKILNSYPDISTALIIEPDSLPNLTTNLGVQKCAAAAPLYREGVAYALKELNLNHTALYLDAAHGGWLGWPDNSRKMAGIFKEVLDQAGGPGVIRGFATNVSNYSPLSRSNPDPIPESYYEFNPARDELTYIKNLRADLENTGVKGKFFLIDTSRNGQPQSRKVWGNWCNIKGAGLGQRPTINPVANVDAYLWLKPPGESDGTSDQSAKRFDTKCRSEDSMSNAPEAGKWFQENFEGLVSRANPAIDP